MEAASSSSADALAASGAAAASSQAAAAALRMLPPSQAAPSFKKVRRKDPLDFMVPMLPLGPKNTFERFLYADHNVRVLHTDHPDKLLLLVQNLRRMRRFSHCSGCPPQHS